MSRRALLAVVVHDFVTFVNRGCGGGRELAHADAEQERSVMRLLPTACGRERCSLTATANDGAMTRNVRARSHRPLAAWLRNCERPCLGWS